MRDVEIEREREKEKVKERERDVRLLERKGELGVIWGNLFP